VRFLFFFQPKTAVSAVKKKIYICCALDKKQKPVFEKPVFALTKQNTILKMKKT